MTSLHFKNAYLTFSTDCQTRRCQFIFVSIYPAWQHNSPFGQNKNSQNCTSKTNKTWKKTQYDIHVEKRICKRKTAHKNVPQSWSELSWMLEKEIKRKIHPKVNIRLKNATHHVICRDMRRPNSASTRYSVKCIWIMWHNWKSFESFRNESLP